MKWSVILVSRNGSDTLPMALAALAQAHVPPGGREVLLVDNASTDSTQPLMRGFAEHYGARLLIEPEPGKAYALNRAIDAAQGEFLAFIDDDIVVDPNWLLALNEAARTSHADVLAGSLVPRWLAPPPRWLAHLAKQGRACGCTRPDAPVQAYPPSEVKGGNMAVRRASLDDLRFDTGPANFGAGKGAAGGEDTLLATNLARAGSVIIHVPAALGRHIISRSEMGLGFVLSRFMRIGRGDAAQRGMGLAQMPFAMAKAAAHTVLALGWLLLLQPTRAADHLPQLGMNLGRIAALAGAGRR